MRIRAGCPYRPRRAGPWPGTDARSAPSGSGALARAAGLRCVHPRPYKVAALQFPANAARPGRPGRPRLRSTSRTLSYSDITYIFTMSGWAYLPTQVIDGCSRKVVGWSVADNMREEMMIDAACPWQPGTGTLASVMSSSIRTGLASAGRAFRDACLSSGIIPVVRENRHYLRQRDYRIMEYDVSRRSFIHLHAWKDLTCTACRLLDASRCTHSYTDTESTRLSVTLRI